MKQWEKQERRVAKRRGTNRHAGSGSGWLHPNDQSEPGILWEMKSTGKRQITISEDDWEKVRSNAMLSGNMPAMHLELGAKKRRLVVIPEDDFEERFPHE